MRCRWHPRAAPWRRPTCRPTATIDIHDLYPRPALRRGAVARVEATCRVLADFSLCCRAAQVVGRGDTRDAALDRQFELATVAAFATVRVPATTRTGAPSAGDDVTPMRMVWQLPE